MRQCRKSAGEMADSGFGAEIFAGIAEHVCRFFQPCLGQGGSGPFPNHNHDGLGIPAWSLSLVKLPRFRGCFPCKVVVPSVSLS